MLPLSSCSPERQDTLQNIGLDAAYYPDLETPDEPPTDDSDEYVDPYEFSARNELFLLRRAT